MGPLIIALCFVCITVCLWCALYWWPQRRIWALADKLPGPRSYPLIGNSLLFMGKMADNLPRMMGLFEEFGPVVRLWFGPRLYVLLRDPDDVQVILGDPKIRNRDWKMTKSMAPFFGNGLLSLRGDQWRTHRKLITPTFHFKILECFIEVFGRKSKILMERLEQLEGKTFDVYNILSLCTLDAICETAIGTTMNSQVVGHSEFIDCLDACVTCIHRRSIRPWLSIDFIYKLSPDGRRAKPLIKTAHAFSETVIAKKLDEFRRGIRSPGITTANNKKISSFLDMLIEASENQGSILSPEEMRDEVTTMAAAGLETTASTMSFLLVLIAMHPEVQAEIHQELDEVFGDDERPATAEDIQKLIVLERSIKETLRLFPIVSLLPREIDEDVQLPSGYTLPGGSSAILLAYAIHRDARYFPNPLSFQPDRWLPENQHNNHPYAYIPFSAGPRNCVGQKYAQLQMKSVLSQVLRRYRVTTPLTFAIFDHLELAVTICLDQALGERYCIQLHKRHCDRISC